MNASILAILDITEKKIQEKRKRERNRKSQLYAPKDKNSRRGYGLIIVPCLPFFLI